MTTNTTKHLRWCREITDSKSTIKW
jgi:hypothetical protein